MAGSCKITFKCIWLLVFSISGTNHIFVHFRHLIIFTYAVWMGDSCSDFRHNDYLHLCSHLPSNPAFWNAFFWIFSDCLQETNIIRVSACV